MPHWFTLLADFQWERLAESMIACVDEALSNDIRQAGSEKGYAYRIFPNR